jgi:hypothetical protein
LMYSHFREDAEASGGTAGALCKGAASARAFVSLTSVTAWVTESRSAAMQKRKCMASVSIRIKSVSGACSVSKNADLRRNGGGVNWHFVPQQTDIRP